VNALDLIRRKRDGGVLRPAEVQELVRSYTAGEVPDYQMSAWLMAVYFQGLDDDESFTLTQAMLESGRVLAFRDLPGPTVDKHSTGGVGDKISIPLAPIVAACGGFVPMISGRGLGHTGGTLDKLESIPGFRTQLSPEAFQEQVRGLGMAFGGQTADLAPADGKLYALRDVTGTVESIPLIVASILSKKFASGTERVVFDVKVGRGAFMKNLGRARLLARALLRTTQSLGKQGRALLTRMDQPLGRAVGNALEVEESIAILKGEGPEDVRDLTIRLAAEMLFLAGLVSDLDIGWRKAQEAIRGGKALARLQAVIERQGGDPSVCDDPARLPKAPDQHPVRAEESGAVIELRAESIGAAVVDLGGGRRTKDDPVDPGVGVLLQAKVGHTVRRGDLLAVVHARGPADAIVQRVRDAYTLSDERAAPPPDVVLDTEG